MCSSGIGNRTHFVTGVFCAPIHGFEDGTVNLHADAVIFQKDCVRTHVQPHKRSVILQFHTQLQKDQLRQYNIPIHIGVSPRANGPSKSASMPVIRYSFRERRTHQSVAKTTHNRVKAAMLAWANLVATPVYGSAVANTPVSLPLVVVGYAVEDFVVSLMLARAGRLVIVDVLVSLKSA